MEHAHPCTHAGSGKAVLETKRPWNSGKVLLVPETGKSIIRQVSMKQSPDCPIPMFPFQKGQFCSSRSFESVG